MDVRTQQNSDNSTPEGQKKRRWHMLLFLLFLIMLVTSCAAGYILGKSSRFSDYSNGKAIDTIYVTKPDSEAKVHLGGKIFYSDGTPYANGTVQLNSEPKQTVTDSKGAFIFKDAEGGEHTISILDSQGNIVTKREFSISKEQIEEGARIKLLNNEKYQMEISVDIKYLEVQIEINKEDGKIYINPDKVTYLTDDGIVVSPTGKADIKNGAVVTPMGNVVTTDGTIICGSGENDNQKVIIPSGNLKNKEDGSIETPDGTQVKPDGTVVIHDTVIDTQGISVTRDGNKREPGEGGYQILEQDNRVNQVPLGAETEKLIDGTGSGQEQNTQEQGRTGNQTPGSQNQTNADTEPSDNPADVYTPDTDIPDMDIPEGNTPPANDPGPSGPDTDTPQTPVDNGPDNGVEITRGTDSGNLSAWQQNSQIDLFYNRTSGMDDKSLIEPGSEGYYLFRLSNNNHFSISFSLSVSENEIHLPLEFAIADASGNLLTSWTAAAGQKEISTEKITLKNRGTGLYQIKWRWPYHTSDAQDAADTRTAELDDRIYTVNLAIRAEEQ